jgi:serine/threonine protein kinase
MSEPPTEAWLRSVIDPLLDALEMLHAEGFYHRDIAPDNVLVSDDAPPVLLDFGAARRVISDRSQNLTAILKPSYAPIEQYAESAAMRQGPWTDFYALGATLHYMITGKPPMPATARSISDEQPRLAGSGQGGVPDLLLELLANRHAAVARQIDVRDDQVGSRAPDRLLGRLGVVSAMTRIAGVGGDRRDLAQHVRRIVDRQNIQG